MLARPTALSPDHLPYSVSRPVRVIAADRRDIFQRGDAAQGGGTGMAREHEKPPGEALRLIGAKNRGRRKTAVR